MKTTATATATMKTTAATAAMAAATIPGNTGCWNNQGQ
jgi:hypothetical protein